MALATGVLIVLLAYLLRWIFGSKQRSNDHYMWLVFVLMLGAGNMHALDLSKPAQGLKILPIGSSCGLAPGLVQQQLLPKFSHPKDWYIILICDDRTWNDIQHTGTAVSTIGVTDYAFSDLTHNFTYVRASKLVNPDPGWRVRPEFILAHEAAHIITRCPADKNGEKLADMVAQQLLQHIIAVPSQK